MSLAFQVFRVTNINFLPTTSIHQNSTITNSFNLLSNSLKINSSSGNFLIYQQNLGWSAKSKIPDRPGFFRHMKTKLNVCRVKRSFKPYKNEHNSVKDTGEKGKKPCDIDLKIAMKILFYYPLSPNTKILKTFLKTFPSKIKKKWGKKIENRGEERKRKVKSQHCCVTFKHKKFCFLHVPKLCKLIFCNWIRRPRSVRPANGFVVSFSS